MAGSVQRSGTEPVSEWTLLHFAFDQGEAAAWDAAIEALSAELSLMVEFDWAEDWIVECDDIAAFTLGLCLPMRAVKYIEDVGVYVRGEYEERARNQLSSHKVNWLASRRARVRDPEAEEALCYTLIAHGVGQSRPILILY